MPICVHCNASLVTKTALNTHQRTVKYCLAIQGKINKNFPCEKCGNYFTTYERLKSHSKSSWCQKINLDKTIIDKKKQQEIDKEFDPEPKPWPKNPNYLIYPDSKIYSKYKEDFRIPHISQKYLSITMYDTESKGHNMRVHRLVAELFCPNPDNKPHVDHIDRNPLNNHYSNLRWATIAENNKNKKQGIKTRKVYQWLDDKMVVEYDSIVEAAKLTGTSKYGISDCCRGKQKVAQDSFGNKYHWSYVEEKEKIDIPENSREIHDYPGYYLTDKGNVYSVYRKMYIKPQNLDGYCNIKLSVNNKRKWYMVHRLVAETFIDDKPENYRDLDVNHKNGNRSDNRINNLEYMTRSQNIQHSSDVLGNSCKPVRIRNNQLGITKEFPSIKLAAKYIGITFDTLSRCIMQNREIYGWTGESL